MDEAEESLVTTNDLCDRVEQLEKLNEVLKDDLALVKGIVQVQDKQLVTCKRKIVDLTARSMANNIVISGITGDSPEENCEEKVKSFLTQKMKMTIEDSEILAAHRFREEVGQKNQDKLWLDVHNPCVIEFFNSQKI